MKAQDQNITNSFDKRVVSLIGRLPQHTRQVWCVALSLLFMSLFVANAGTSVVLVNALATTDEDYGSGTIVNTNYRTLQVYAANQFTNAELVITGLVFRPDRHYGKAFSTVISNIQVNMSTTTATPGSLSSTFDANVGADDKVVFSGAAYVMSSFSGPSQGPKDFDIYFPLACPFVYHPANGNLVIDIRNFSGSDASLLSGSGSYGTVGSRVAGSMASSTGTADSGADAIKLVCATGPDANVVPNALATEDYIFGSGTLKNTNYHIQQVYAANQFPGGTLWIHEMRFRPDRFYGNSFSTVISNLEVRLSTTTAAPGSLSTTYSSNIGANEQVVVSGETAVSSAFTGPSQGPKDADIIIKFICPFAYQPAFGNLLIDIRNTSGSGASLLSGSSVYGSVASRVGGNLGSSSGGADSGADAIKLIYAQ